MTNDHIGPTTRPEDSHRMVKWSPHRKDPGRRLSDGKGSDAHIDYDHIGDPTA
jgi:hypothetical protein